MLDRYKWNVDTSQALVRNFLPVNNFATWLLVLQRFLLHFVCVCGFFCTVFNITTQLPAPPKKQWSENLVLQRFLLHCVCVCVFFLGGGTGLWYWTHSQKKKTHTHNGVRTTAVPEIRLQTILHWKSFMFSFLPPVMQLYLCIILMTLFTFSLLDQQKFSSNVTKNMYLLECNNVDGGW
jgi:hypothetical protein